MDVNSMEILVVDDQKEIVDLLSSLLTRNDFAVRVARDGAEAVAMVKTRRPDLVLMDVEMPHLSGIAACRFLRADPWYDQMPIVLLTSDDSPETIVQGLVAGANDYVLKSAPHVELIARINRHLSTLAAFRDQLTGERLAAIQQIALSVQHEIFNPLASVIGFLDLAARQPDLTERTRKQLLMARAEATRIEAIVRRLNSVEDKRVDPFGIGDMIDLTPESLAGQSE